MQRWLAHMSSYWRPSKEHRLVFDTSPARLSVQTVLQGTLEGSRRRGRQTKSRMDNWNEWNSLLID
ncbi:hypothetical protein DPMN_157945 [Dreissena polymorpha]|uniref:Uncharacterized protein n=1 Tax=Dreissena polymorpha TaxID=45954 RepID=A0A9D4ELD9_DREPO|nr:hypothetical protein DPMN_157945 [Dreissena polymorpha]